MRDFVSPNISLIQDTVTVSNCRPQYLHVLPPTTMDNTTQSDLDNIYPCSFPQLVCNSEAFLPLCIVHNSRLHNDTRVSACGTTLG